jgi:hypothetical protein
MAENIAAPEHAFPAPPSLLLDDPQNLSLTPLAQAGDLRLFSVQFTLAAGPRAPVRKQIFMAL